MELDETGQSLLFLDQYFMRYNQMVDDNSGDILRKERREN